MKSRKVQDAFIKRCIKENHTQNGYRGFSMYGRSMYCIFQNSIKNKRVRIISTKRKYIPTPYTAPRHNFGFEQFLMTFEYLQNDEYSIKIIVTERWIQNLTKEETAALMIHKIKGDIKWEDCP